VVIGAASVSARRLPPEVERELAEIVERYGAPLVRTHEVVGELFDPLTKKDRYGEVCMIVRRRSGRLVTATKTFYPPDVYRLLTGGIHHGEPIMSALRREAREETGLELAVVRFLAMVVYTRRTEPIFHTFAFLLEDRGGELRMEDEAERHGGFREIDAAALPVIADRLASLDAQGGVAIGGRWRDWGQFRAVIHRAVWEALSASAGTPAPPRSVRPRSERAGRDAP
jgi:8-oxo-dGTP pyrophosphatase MutT (NUDIX family)